jgi:predicted RNase H-like nuclease
MPAGLVGTRGSPLPYQILAGVEPCPGGWLVAPGNLQGITLSPQPAQVMSSLADVLDYRPSFTVVALHAPVGRTDAAGERRGCDVTARDLLGARAGAAVPAPSRQLLDARTFEEAKEIDPSLDIVRWRSLPKAVEAIREVQSWRQRAVWEVNPELAFRQMNDGQVLHYGRRSIHGLQERQRLLETRLPGTQRVLRDRPRGVREGKLLDALADLWTARRVMARAITRLSDPPVWDDEGVRMDIVC